MLTTTLAEIKAHPTRLLGVLLAVGLSIGFVVACVVFVDTEAAAIKRSVAAQTAGSSVVVRPIDDRDLLPAITGTPGVAAAELSRSTWVGFTAGGENGTLEVGAQPKDSRLQWRTLTRGVWPQRDDEVAIGQQTAQRVGVTVGDTIRVRTSAPIPIGGGSTPADITRDLRVVGLLDESASLFSDLQNLGVVAPSSTLLTNTSGEYLVIALPDVSADDLAAALQQRLPSDTEVMTSSAFAEQRLSELSGGIDVIRTMLLAFGSIAALVGSMIISNTFGIVVAQRRRQIALLRAVGATRQQVRRALLGEAVLVGAAGAVLGLVLGLCVAAVAVAVVGSLDAGLALRPLPLALAALAGVAITVVAALAPARRSVVVSPLDALRPVHDPVTARRAGRVRALVGGTLGLIGAAVVGAALARGGSGALVLTIGGSALLAVAIIGLAPAYLPPVFRACARLLESSRPSVRLAAANTVRNPARAAAVCTALMLGVGLIVTLQVGAASVKLSTEASLRNEFPVDAIIRSAPTPLPSEVLTQVRQLPEVRAAIAVSSVEAAVSNGSVRLDGLGPEAGSVVAAGLSRLDSGTALVHASTLGMFDKSDGDSVAIRVGQRTQTFTLRSSDIADFGALVITTQALAKLAPNAPITAVWAAARPDADPAAVMDGIRTVAAAHPALEVGGSLEQAAATSSLLDTLLTISTALTAVAVVIALVGLGNSLALSVIERSRESAVLRALGLQRRQLRWMLAAEAVLLALIGAGVGVVAGIGFGILGAAAIAAEGGFAEARFAISATQTATVVTVSILAGALASVLPGRRAARARPVEALAEA